MERQEVPFSWVQKYCVVYRPTEHGGLETYELDWDNDAAYCEGELCDNAETLRDLFEVEELRHGFYLSMADYKSGKLSKAVF